MDKTAWTVLGVLALAALIVVGGFIGVTDNTTDAPEPQAVSAPAPPDDVNEVRGGITGKSIEGATVRVTVIAENSSAYRCVIPEIKSDIANVTQANALSIDAQECSGVRVKTITFK